MLPFSTVNQTTITCVLDKHQAGDVKVWVHVDGLGYSSQQDFEYNLVVSSVHPAMSGFGGGRLITVKGKEKL